MQMQFAQAATEIEAARLLTYNAARLKEEGADFTKQAAMAKYYSSVVAQKTAGSAIEWAGGMGFTRQVCRSLSAPSDGADAVSLVGKPASKSIGGIVK
jgi:alkylation response protein AidB-like acyl-CoA dehydrogenase